MMTIGFVWLIASGLLILFGAGQRVLDRLRLTDRQAILVIALIIAGGFAPDIPVTERFSFNLGGAAIPLGLCAYLWLKADTGAERLRSLLAALVTAVAVYALGRYMPASPEALPMDPSWAYGLAAGVIAYVFGRSRRGAFIAGALGVTLADVAGWLTARAAGIDQRLALGGAGAYDVIVVAALLAVLLSELIGEALERATRGKRRPNRAFVNGEFTERGK